MFVAALSSCRDEAGSLDTGFCFGPIYRLAVGAFNVSSLDGRSPLVLDVRELGRRAGAMMTFDRQALAPVELSNPMIGIPVGSDLALDLMAESVVEGVWISGDIAATAQGSCSRCLEPVSTPLVVDIAELFRYADLDNEVDDDEIPTFEHDLIDLEPTLRDAVVLALPLAPVCGEDCLGLCSQCGFELKNDPNHQHDQTDPRWAALGKMFTDDSPAQSRESKEEG